MVKALNLKAKSPRPQPKRLDPLVKKRNENKASAIPIIHALKKKIAGHV